MKPKTFKKYIQQKSTPLQNKQFFIGIALGDNNTVETGIAVMNRNLELMRVDKLFTNQEIEGYLASFSGTFDSIVCISLAYNSMQLTSKWREDEKNIHAFSLFNSTEDLLWTDRTSERGRELCQALENLGVNTFRYNIYMAKMQLKLAPPFKMRSQPGCKYLQTVIRDYLSVDNLPTNLIPITSLDAIIGAYTGWKIATDKVDVGYSFVETAKGEKIVLPLKQNPRPIKEEDYKTETKSKKKK